MFGAGLVLTFAVSMWFAIMVDAALSALTIGVVLALARVRCLRCGETIAAPDLTSRERRSLRMQQALSVVLGTAMLALALWSKGNWDRERGVGQHHSSAAELDEAADDSQEPSDGAEEAPSSEE
jgi:hypothetical protein